MAEYGEQKVENLQLRRFRVRNVSKILMGKRGYSLQEIAKVAGHSQISTTMRYTHLRAEDTREALESLGRRNESGLVNLGS